MFHDRQLARVAADPRPASAVSTGVGLAGLVGLALWMTVAKRVGMDGPLAALTALVAAGLPMIGWSLGVDRVHRSASTGLDWGRPRPLRETLDVSLCKLAGLWITWGAMGVVYFAGRFWWMGQFAFAMRCFAVLAPAMLVLSIPYVLWIDRRLAEPRDGAWALGAWATGQAALDGAAVAGHARAWAVKGFFLAFMLAVTPSGWAVWVGTDLHRAVHDPAALAMWLAGGLFVTDVTIAGVGYLLTMRPLDAHIRSANPYAGAWVAALICYPPFVLMETGRPLDYRPGTADWSWWMAGHPWLEAGWGAMLVALTLVYAWATVAFGLRFSNLTNRGIITHGPYAWSRHPAYLSKNLFWWLSTLPIASTLGLVEGMRACLLMAGVSGVYWWRAKSEERHLRLDPAYRDYWAWMERRGAMPRFARWLRGEVRA